jgi:hypothetical protein
VPNLRGSRKTPEPIIDPTTMAVSVGRLTFCSDVPVDASALVTE